MFTLGTGMNNNWSRRRSGSWKRSCVPETHSDGDIPPRRLFPAVPPAYPGSWARRKGEGAIRGRLTWWSMGTACSPLWFTKFGPSYAPIISSGTEVSKHERNES